MTQQPLISIIAPCYNGERFIHRFLESVLNQTYTNLELIFVDDGSTDRTKEVALSYEQAFREKGMAFFYLYQENAGQAAAINKGLEVFRGEYIMFSDSDDWLSEDCVECKLNYLQQHPEKMFVLARAAFVPEGNTGEILSVLERKNTKNGWMFDDLMFERDGYYAPGCYLTRTEAFLSVHPTRQIFAGRGGQNWQILLPLAYKYECGFLDNIVYYILVHPDSHSRSSVTYDQLLLRTREHEEILNQVTRAIEMPPAEKEKYLLHIRRKYIRARLRLAVDFGKKDVAEQQFALLKETGELGLMDKVTWFRGRNGLFNGAYRAAQKLWRKMLNWKGQ